MPATILVRWSGFQFWVKPAQLTILRRWLILFRPSLCAQTTLYGYLRIRAGLQHFNLFTDETFVGMLRPARSRLMLVCVEDLALYCVAVIGERTGFCLRRCKRLAYALWPTPLTSCRSRLPEGELRPMPCFARQAGGLVYAGAARTR